MKNTNKMQSFDNIPVWTFGHGIQICPVHWPMDRNSWHPTPAVFILSLQLALQPAKTNICSRDPIPLSTIEHNRQTEKKNCSVGIRKAKEVKRKSEILHYEWQTIFWLHKDGEMLQYSMQSQMSSFVLFSFWDWLQLLVEIM